jgi:hypothetical protein
VPSRNRENSKKIGNSNKKSEMPEVGWVAESEIQRKIRNSMQKLEIHSKTQLVEARAKTMKNPLPKQLKFHKMSYLRCYSGRPKNSGSEKFDRKFHNAENY